MKNEVFFKVGSTINFFYINDKNVIGSVVLISDEILMLKLHCDYYTHYNISWQKGEEKAFLKKRIKNIVVIKY